MRCSGVWCWRTALGEPAHYISAFLRRQPVILAQDDQDSVNCLPDFCFCFRFSTSAADLSRSYVSIRLLLIHYNGREKNNGNRKEREGERESVPNEMFWDFLIHVTRRFNYTLSENSVCCAAQVKSNYPGERAVCRLFDGQNVKRNPSNLTFLRLDRT